MFSKQHGFSTPIFNVSDIKLLISGYCRSSQLIIPQDLLNLFYKFLKELQMLHKNIKYFELFDIVYYDMNLPQKLVRTLFHQIISEIQLTEMSVIKPYNLLLDSQFSIFLVYHLVPNKTNVSTYTSPEILLNTCDIDPIKSRIFSCGVILFILITGVLPFNIASKSDKWYSMIINNEKVKYFKCFSSQNINISIDIRDLLWGMLQFNANKRYSIKEICASKWFCNGIHLNQNEVITRLKYNFNKKEGKRLRQMIRNHHKIYSIKSNLNQNKIFNILPVLMFPDDEIEGIFDTYCCDSSSSEIYYCLSQVIEDKYNGKTYFDDQKQDLICSIKTNRDSIKFGVTVYESKRWKLAHNDDFFEYNINEYSALYTIRFYRIQGDCYEFLRIKNEYLLECADIMSGLSAKQRRAFRALYGKKIANAQPTHIVYDRSKTPDGYFDVYNMF